MSGHPREHDEAEARFYTEDAGMSYTREPADAPERTLSDRIRMGHYFDRPMEARHKLADEVATLEQEQKRLRDTLGHSDPFKALHDARGEVERLRAEIREILERAELHSDHGTAALCRAALRTEGGE